MRGFAQTQWGQNVSEESFNLIWNLYPHTISRHFFHHLMLYKLKIWRKYFLDMYITFQLKLHKVFEPIMPKDWICFCYYYVHIVFVMEVGTHSYTLTLCSSSCSKSQKKVTFIFGGRHQKKTVFRKRIAQVSGHNES